MAAPAKKIDVRPDSGVSVEAKPSSENAEIIAAAEGVDIDPVASPAKALQDKLDAHFLPMGKTMSARFVTLLVMFTCVGTWVSGIGLYGAL
jgi:hypothetical protein